MSQLTLVSIRAESSRCGIVFGKSSIRYSGSLCEVTSCYRVDDNLKGKIPENSKLAAERCYDPWAFQVIGRLIADRLGQTEAAEATHRRGLDCVTETLEAELRS